MKKCFKCEIEKDLSQFYKHSDMKDGYLNKCKGCSKSESIAYYTKKIKEVDFYQKEKDRGRKKSNLSNRVNKANPAANERYLLKYPEKKKAATQSASLKRPFLLAEKHHWSYNEEHYKDVIWLIKKEHKKAHRFIVYDQERMMYRRYDTNELLDIKDKHEEFIKYCINEKED